MPEPLLSADVLSALLKQSPAIILCVLVWIELREMNKELSLLASQIVRVEICADILVND